MSEKFKPGLRNIYLRQGPREDNGEQTLCIVSMSGRKGDKFADGGAWSLNPKVHYAFLEQVHVETQEELLAKFKALHETWVRPYDLSPTEVSE
jgi:hypothetical protein